MNRLTKPSTQTLRGRGGRLLTARLIAACRRRKASRSTLAQSCNLALSQIFARHAIMTWGSSPVRLRARFARRSSSIGRRTWPRPSAQGQQRELARRGCGAEPATLNQVAAKVGRGAPAVSRSIDALVRAGLVERTQDPDNRRRLALRLTEEGRAASSCNRPACRRPLARRTLGQLAHSELRALERGDRDSGARCRASAVARAALQHEPHPLCARLEFFRENMK